MKETTSFLKEIISMAGLSGYEQSLTERIQQEWQPLVSEMYKTKLNSLHGLVKGKDNSQGHKILITAHIDAIGFIVSSTKEGLLKITPIGGIDARVLLGQHVHVHTDSEIMEGIIVLPPSHTLKPKTEGTFSIDDLVVDTGYRPSQVTKKVKIGNLVSFANEPLELTGNYIAGHSIDNRASVATLTQILKLIKNQSHQWDVVAAATVQEEVGLKGGITSAFVEKPTIAIILDVDFGKGPGSQGHDSHELDKGPVLTWGPTNHPHLFNEIESLANRLEIPIQKSVVAGLAGTEGDAIQIALDGIPSLLIGVPIRYMHTSKEMVQMRDIDRLARLLTAFILELDENFLEKLKWEVEKDDEYEN
jgi:tetrahedral aminopeptidase